ncbi:MAG: ABC transporter ATP-binding protein [Oceanospirillaceae bacterium]|uniref:ABC transporter ATP-binding protein n=1 Tax=unclassified Thalassolituus TaxID=2624967 RepID=UPI000C55FD32|nr:MULTISPECIES: ABC transporter ATP-binding protein [unclassified Thalassolituus]MAS26294.1 ABC transporter ATP-binding protein [Oceanospirillaceae bacterium]MBS53293.1 ABC transporter ATP-binding protein [Oceanospirillaceae bacterium]|tara:strand:- start:2907 stop:4430 length:1524 start_codon:yes stop_codon:yes gene_type:complete
MSKQNAIHLKGVSKSFDGFYALSEAAFTVKWGEVHALLGENGAGKSTLMNIVTGLYGPETGIISIDDNEVSFSGPRDASRARIGMVHQHFKLVSPFTVVENVMLSLTDVPVARSYRQRLEQVAKDIIAKGEELGFAINPYANIYELSVAEQQRVEIIKALVSGARILILDEPSAVLTDAESDSLLSTMRDFAAAGGAVVLVTHKMKDVFRFADMVTVMRQGRTIETVVPSSVSSEELIRMTVGESTTDTESTEFSVGGDTALSVSNLSSLPGSAPAELNGVNFRVASGQIYGIAGVGGNGQTELADVLMGVRSDVSGEVTLAGNADLLAMNFKDRRDYGIACIPADRYQSALGAQMSVSENFALGRILNGDYGSVWFLNRSKLDAEASAAVKEYDVQGVRSMRQKAALLSGGNAQKLVIAREFSHAPSLVLVHSPSRGLDVKASQAVRKKLIEARDAGAAVLLISEDLDEILKLSDRIGVMSGGAIVAEFDQPADRHAIGEAMVNHV